MRKKRNMSDALSAARKAPEPSTTCGEQRGKRPLQPTTIGNVSIAVNAKKLVQTPQLQHLEYKFQVLMMKIWTVTLKIYWH